MMDFIKLHELGILRWLHIVAMVYWLAGEWGVFQTSYKVVNPKLPYDERMRHMDTAYRIDIMARTGIISLLPLGLHMGYLWGLQPLGGGWLTAMWIVYAAWFALTWIAFAKRNTPSSKMLYRLEDATRYIIIPLLIISGITSLMGHGPFEAGPGTYWYSAKVLTFGVALIIGFILRIVMHEWQPMFKILAQGPNEAVELKLEKSINLGRSVAYIYWVLILSAAFFGAVKPF